MRKIVPDPPSPLDPSYMLQDTLVQTSEYVICALSVARQSVRLTPTSHNSIVMRAVIHEMEVAHALLESALMQLHRQAESPTEPQTVH